MAYKKEIYSSDKAHEGNDWEESLKSGNIYSASRVRKCA